MLGNSHQVVHAVEPRLLCQIVRDFIDGNRLNRIHDDVTFVHLVTTTYLDLKTLPDADGASDSPAADSLAKALGEHHVNLSDGRGNAVQR